MLSSDFILIKVLGGCGAKSLMAQFLKKLVSLLLWNACCNRLIWMDMKVANPFVVTLRGLRRMLNLLKSLHSISRTCQKHSSVEIFCVKMRHYNVWFFLWRNGCTNIAIMHTSFLVVHVGDYHRACRGNYGNYCCWQNWMTSWNWCNYCCDGLHPVWSAIIIAINSINCHELGDNYLLGRSNTKTDMCAMAIFCPYVLVARGCNYHRAWSVCSVCLSR